ncbi:MAG TPA: 50S ribosomal protein L9 [Planctomycetota bacterium]|jgi:large subunit ribosomal protein L9|nr:50S ribosomal protein L9 [Planctomycetota bacterium]
MSRHVQVLLRADVEKLGRPGEVVRVRPGFARNFLLPRALAVPVTEENLRRIEKEKAKRATEEHSLLEGLRAIGEQIAAAAVNIEAKVGEEGRLYGSVGTAQIAQAFAALGLPVEEKQVRLEHPIKERGVFPVKIHLHPQVEIETKVWIVEEKSPGAGGDGGV